LAGNRVNAIYQDKEGAIWFGTGGGVSRFDGNSWTTYTKEDGLVGNWVGAIYQDKEGAIWFGAGGGVSRFDGNSWTTYTQEDGLAGNLVRAIFQDKEGVIWFGTSSSSGGMVTIHRDREGIFAEGGGVTRFDGESWKTYTKEDGLAEGLVQAILQDKEGAMWFGTWLRGVSRFDGESWKRYTVKDRLVNNNVRAILQDKEGALWFVTEGGVSRFDGKEWTTYTQKDGLASNLVRAIFQDKKGVMWFGTEEGGVGLFDGRCFQTIDSRDGLASDWVNCVYMDRSGHIWLGTRDGVTRFISNKIPPPVYITQMITDQTYTNPKGTIQLSSGIRRISFSYHAISFKTRPGGIKYFYQLVGQDADWQGPTNKETVEYLGLKPGEYTFKVQGVDRDLNYSDTPASVEVIIPPPPFYKQTVFIATVVSVGGGLLFIVILLAVNQWRLSQAEQHRLKQELEDARQIQTGLLPDSTPSVPGFEIDGFSEPAREVGGDFYDYLTLSTNLIGIALADVSDKGLKAAMNAVMTNGMLHESVKSEREAAKLLGVLNAGLHPRLQRPANVAFAFFILDPQTKILTYANAGQPLPVIKRKEEVWEAELIGGFPLGAIANVEYEQKTIRFEAGDYVILYSDGISEAMNEEEDMYTEERIIEAICQADANFSAEEMTKHLLQDVMAFVGNAEQYDDMTLVVIHCLNDSSDKD